MDKCKYCQRTNKDIKLIDIAGEAVCTDCGYEKPRSESTTEPFTMETKVEQPVNLDAFIYLLRFVSEWRAVQIKNQKLTTKKMSAKTLPEVVLALEMGINKVKEAIVMEKQYESVILLLDTLVHGLAFLEAHPSILVNE